MPTLIPITQKISNLPATAILETIKPLKKPPKIRIFQKDEVDIFTKQDQTISLNDITEGTLKTIALNFMIYGEEGFLTLFRIDKNINGISDVSYCIRIDQNLRVMFFYIETRQYAFRTGSGRAEILFLIVSACLRIL